MNSAPETRWPSNPARRRCTADVDARQYSSIEKAMRIFAFSWPLSVGNILYDGAGKINIRSPICGTRVCKSGRESGPDSQRAGKERGSAQVPYASGIAPTSGKKNRSRHGRTNACLPAPVKSGQKQEKSCGNHAVNCITAHRVMPRTFPRQPVKIGLPEQWESYGETARARSTISPTPLRTAVGR